MNMRTVALSRMEKTALFDFAKSIPKDTKKICPVVLLREIDEYKERFENDDRYSGLFHAILAEMYRVINHIVCNPKEKVWQSLSGYSVKTESARMAKKIIKIAMFEFDNGYEKRKKRLDQQTDGVVLEFRTKEAFAEANGELSTDVA